MIHSPFLEFFFPTCLLLVAIADDLRSKKIHNRLILILLPIVLILVLLLKGFIGLKLGLISALLALMMGVPLNLARILGGGDLKILVLFSLMLHWRVFFYSFAYSLPWALLLGIFKILLDKQIKEFLFNLFFLFKFKKLEKTQLHTIPFSVALLFGWLSQYYMGTY